MIEKFAVTADEVRRQMRGGVPLFFVGVRHRHDWDVAVMKARGALRLNEDEVAEHLDEIPKDRPVIVYTNCPGDEPSFEAADVLRQNNIEDVHPLLGGFRAYLKNGLPVEEIGEGSEARKIMLL